MFTSRLIALILAVAPPYAYSSGETRLEFTPTFNETPIQFGAPLVDGDLTIRLSRLDWFISNLDFQRADSTWQSSEDWVGFLSHSEGRDTVSIPGLPDGKYQAIRFLIGLTPKINTIDVNEILPGSPLHPLVNGMHWGWSDGFIFTAIEGHFGKENEGFSYHLATSGNAVEVTVPLEFNAPTDSTISLNLDLGSFFKAIRPGREPTSSHSREKDPLIPEMQNSLKTAFHFTSVSTDLFQTPEVEGTTESVPPIGSPYRLSISERFPQAALPADNPLTHEGVELGKSLFFSPLLSGNNTQSCSSCHQPDAAFSDKGKVLSVGAQGLEGDRNSMPLFNLLWHDRFFWDGRANSLREQVLHPISDTKELNQPIAELVQELQDHPTFPDSFAAAFGSSGISEETISKALEQFLLTLISQDSHFDRAAKGLAELSDEEKRGLELFVTEHDPENGLLGADCFHCHGGNLFSNRRFTNNGLQLSTSDVGLALVSESPQDRGKFKTPSLRNVALTAPYMHDGRFQTLKEVIDHYDSGVHRSESLDPNLAKHPSSGLGLSEEDKAALIHFLHTLTDFSYLEEPVTLSIK